MDYEQPDYVLMDKVQTGPEGEALVWPYEMNTQDFPWEWIEKHMEALNRLYTHLSGVGNKTC